ncbi:MAG TPA: hypothetical protein VKG38_15765 [Solirubrobacteraceae bacterium]|nr:hypothetical protein [Solirubrobacteraceae bacterium]HME71148.1 hypothetical protein [Myxococcota bacterium]
MPKGVVAPDRVRAYVTKLAQQGGTEAASEKLEMSRETVARLMAGLPVHKGTVAQVEKKLTEEKGGRT